MSSEQLIERWCKEHATPATVQWLVDNFEPAEGSSIRRSILYNFYLEHCLILKVEPLNPASFGKLIHSVFLGLKTRRLGTRGNSKYHYYGIQVKSSSPLVKQMPFENEFDSQTIHLNMSPNEYIFSPSNQQNTCNSLTDFFFPPLINEEFSMEDIKIFQKTHDDYSTKLYQVLIKFQYDSIEKLIEQFWSLTNIHHAQTTDPTTESNRLKDYPDNSDPTLLWKFHRICTLPFILDQFRLFYPKFYQTLIEHYFPDIFIQTHLESIRTIANNISYWLIHAIEHLYPPLKSFLIQSTHAFSSILLRYTSCNHLALTIQTMFFQTSRLLTMSMDLTLINFNDLHEQINWLIECDLNLFRKIEQCLKNLFQCQTMLTIQNWTTFIDTLFDDYLLNSPQTKEYLSYARQFLLKTNFYCSLILRELTLHYGQSLGSFHLLQLFIEEYLYYRLEQKLAGYSNQTIVHLVMENIHKQQQEKDFFHDEDLEDDFESFSDDLNEQRNSFKPLSPVPMEEFLLPDSTLTQSFSYIFEDLQPLSNEIFSI